jgi:hypothetical protein
LRQPCPGVIDQQVAHLLCGDGEEVGPVLPRHRLTGEQLEVQLVDQRGRLQGVSRPFLLQMPCCQAAQFLVGGSKQALSGLPVAGAPLAEELGQGCGIIGHC